MLGYLGISWDILGYLGISQWGELPDDYWPEEAAGRRSRAVGTAGPFQGLLADREQRTLPSTPPGPQYLSGTTGRMDPPDGYHDAGVHRGKRMNQPCDLQGAGRASF